MWLDRARPSPGLYYYSTTYKYSPCCQKCVADDGVNLWLILQEIWPVVGILIEVMSDPKCETTVLRIFSSIARHSAVPFLTHLRKIKLMVDNNPSSLPAAAGIFGAVGKLGEVRYLACSYVYIHLFSITVRDNSQSVYFRRPQETLYNIWYPDLSWWIVRKFHTWYERSERCCIFIHV